MTILDKTNINLIDVIRKALRDEGVDDAFCATVMLHVSGDQNRHGYTVVASELGDEELTSVFQEFSENG